MLLASEDIKQNRTNERGIGSVPNKPYGFCGR